MSAPHQGRATARDIHSGSLREQLRQATARAERAEAERDTAVAGLAAVMAAHGGGGGDMPDVWPVALGSCHDVVKLPGERVVVLAQSRPETDPRASWAMLMNSTGWRQR